MVNAFAFGAGLLFAVGLGIGGMTQPARIVGFLDIAGHWDPSLVYVLAGAVGTYMLLNRWIRRRRHPVYAMQFQIPRVRTIDGRLVLGAAAFGVGWGIGGFCPGPAVTALVSLHPAAVVTALSIGIGTAVFDWVPWVGRSPGSPAGPRSANASASTMTAPPRPSVVDG